MDEGPRIPDLAPALTSILATNEELQSSTQLDIEFCEFSRRINVATARFNDLRQANALADGKCSQQMEELLYLWREILRRYSRTRPSPSRVWALSKELADLKPLLSAAWCEGCLQRGNSASGGIVLPNDDGIGTLVCRRVSIF